MLRTLGRHYPHVPFLMMMMMMMAHQMKLLEVYEWLG
jgi:hypothetical protein